MGDGFKTWARWERQQALGDRPGRKVWRRDCWCQQHSGLLNTSFQPLAHKCPSHLPQIAGVSARREMKNVDAIHFPKQHIASSQSGNLIYRALKCPFVAEWVDRHHKHLAPAPTRASTVHWIITPLSSHLRRECRAPSFQIWPITLATLVFLEAFLSLILSQPLICHSPDKYKLKPNNERGRPLLSRHHLQLSEPRAGSRQSP